MLLCRSKEEKTASLFDAAESSVRLTADAAIKDILWAGKVLVIIMFINKDGKLFGKISIIDIVVIIAIVLVGCGAYLRFLKPNQKVETVNQTIEYTMRVAGVRVGTVEALKNFSPIYNCETKEYLGEIVGIEYAEATEDKIMHNGEIKNLPIPERYDVILKVRVDGKVNSSGFYTATNQAIYAGASHTFSSKYAQTTGRIDEVREVQ